MTTEIDAEGLAKARDAFFDIHGPMSGFDTDALVSAIRAYLSASRSTSEAEPVAWQWRVKGDSVWVSVTEAPVFKLGAEDLFEIRPLYTLPTPASDDQVEAVAMLALIREEAAKDNAPLGRSDSLALERIRSVLGLPSGGRLAAMGSTKP